MGVVSGKTIPSNTSWAGNPAKQIAKDIFWDGRCVHGWTQPETEANQHYDSQSHIFKQEDPTTGLTSFADKLYIAKSAAEMVDLCDLHLLNNDNHNRFSIDPPSPKPIAANKSVFKKLLKKLLVH